MAARSIRSHDAALAAALVLAALTLGACAPRNGSDTATTAGASSAADDPARRAIEDRIVTLDHAVPLMRKVRRTDHGKDGGTLELVGWLESDSIVVVQGAARLGDGGGGEFRYYYDGPRVLGFRRTDRYPTGPPALAGKVLQSAAYLAPDGRPLLWSQTVEGKPVPMRADRRDWLVRQWSNEGAGWRTLMTRVAADSLSN